VRGRVRAPQLSQGVRQTNPMSSLPVIAVVLMLMSCTPRGVATRQSERIALLKELRQCLDALPKRVHAPVNSPCAERRVSILEGVSRRDVLNALGDPTWCHGPDGLIALDRAECPRSQVWGYSYYRLPNRSCGGGPELTFEFARDSAAKAGWVWTQ
jgi:hypothetical protein